MSILSENADLNIEFLWPEVFIIDKFHGAAECNPNMAKKKFYANIAPNDETPLKTLQLRLQDILAGKYAMDFFRVDAWIDVFKSLVQVRPGGKMRIGITKRSNMANAIWDPYDGPEVVVTIERQGMRKQKHWYPIITVYTRAIDKEIAKIIVDRLECRKNRYTYFYTDDNGTFIRES